MSSLEKSLDIWCADIHKLSKTTKFKYDENSIYGFKNSEATRDAYQTLRDEIDYELTKENMNSYIVQLFCKVDPLKLGKISFYFLSKMCFTKKLINVTANECHLKKLNEVLMAALGEPNQLLEESIISSQRKDSKIMESSDEEEIGDPNDFDNFFRYLMRDLEKRFTSTMTAVLDGRFEARLATFIKETQASCSTNNDLVNLARTDSSFVTENLINMTQDGLYNMIRYRAKKILICQHEMKLLKIHIKQNTTPIKLSHTNFPYPFLIDDMKFTVAYDKLVSKTQVEIMEFVIKYLETQCVQMLESEIDETVGAIRCTTGMNDDEISQQIFEIYEVETQKLKDQFTKDLSKASRMRKTVFEDLLKKKIRNRRMLKIKIKTLEPERDSDEQSNTSRTITKLRNKTKNSKPTMAKSKRVIQQPLLHKRSLTSKHSKTINTKQPEQRITPQSRPGTNQDWSNNTKPQSGNKSVLDLKLDKENTEPLKKESPQASDRSLKLLSQPVSSVVVTKSNNKKETNVTLVEETRLITDPQAEKQMNKIIKNVVNNRLVNPFSSKKKSLPQLKKQKSREGLNTPDTDECEPADHCENYAMKSSIVAITEPFNFSQKTEYKEIVSKVMTLRNLTKNKSHQANVNSYNNLLFKNDSNTNGGFMKVVIKDKSNHMTQSSLPSEKPTRQNSFLPQHIILPECGLVPQNTMIGQNSTVQELSHSENSYNKREDITSSGQNLKQNLSEMQETRRIVRVCIK